MVIGATLLGVTSIAILWCMAFALILIAIRNELHELRASPAQSGSLSPFERYADMDTDDDGNYTEDDSLRADFLQENDGNGSSGTSPSGNSDGSDIIVAAAEAASEWRAKRTDSDGS
ncbi:hypothetical protein P280DRAFT_518937 [Massarina eburnea CBS 473.64]|uniref:Uncharacterized protein n=1 Tax=Massarina eburnea CBS 473.64 TaxID=1395130 RepID=A0A6A6RWK5_9PLEO|nr:hypothetical protein P280DRAFT_518937 [Massarina eburnea CBS 473.64]